MSRRKHKNRAATPCPPLPAPASPSVVPTATATDGAPGDGYHDSLPIRHRHAAGIDLGLLSHWACAPPLPDGTAQLEEFDTYTDSLFALADWLAQRGVRTVALEATGVYWEPLFAILQARGFHVIRVAPHYTSSIQGRPKRRAFFFTASTARVCWTASSSAADTLAGNTPGWRPVLRHQKAQAVGGVSGREKSPKGRPQRSKHGRTQRDSRRTATPGNHGQRPGCAPRLLRRTARRRSSLDGVPLLGRRV